MKLYKYYQPNKKDLKDEQGDCSIRALTKFMDITWVEAFDMLVKYARESQTIINAISNIKACLEDAGVAFVSCYKPKDKKKMVVKDFVKQNKQGTFILHVRVGFGTHLVCCVDGVYYDTWDCGDKIVYGYWKKV